MNYMVSVICLAYNHEKYIRQTLEGFISQKTNFPFEVIIHDDASTDGTTDIIRTYSEQYPDIFHPIFQKENQHSKHIKISRTIISDHVSGKYVAFCEGDDYWIDPLKLQKQYDFMELHPDYSMCVCPSKWFNMQTGNVTVRPKIDEDCDVSIEEVILERNGRYFQTASYFIRTDIWKQWPKWRDSYPVGDIAMALQAGIHGKIRMMSDVMCVYRFRSPGSWTARMEADRDKKIQMYQRMSAALHEFDIETDGKYSKIVEERRRRFKYDIAILQRDWNAIRSEELKHILKNRSLIRRLADRIHCNTPWLYKKILTIRAGITNFFSHISRKHDTV